MSKKKPTADAANAPDAADTATHTIATTFFNPSVLAPAVASAMTAEAEVKAQTWIITSAVEQQIVFEYLQEKLREKDLIVETRKSATGPLYKVIKLIESWFQPGLKPYDLIETVLRAALGAWEVKQIEEQNAARAEAARQLQAAQTPGAPAPDWPVLTTALQAANAQPTKVKGLSAATGWVATVIAPDLLDRKWLAPDLEKIQAHADQYGSHEQPFAIPGVTFKLEASTRVRR